MRIVVATTGALNPEPAAIFARRLAEPDGVVYVVTVIEVPRSFLDEIRAEPWHPMPEDPARTDHEDAVIARYVEERGTRATAPLVEALRARGLDAKVMFLESESPATAIVEAADEIGADLVVVGATKTLFDETQWESVSARVMREARCSVLVIPAGPVPEIEEQ